MHTVFTDLTNVELAVVTLIFNRHAFAEGQELSLNLINSQNVFFLSLLDDEQARKLARWCAEMFTRVRPTCPQ